MPLNSGSASKFFKGVFVDILWITPVRSVAIKGWRRSAAPTGIPTCVIMQRTAQLTSLPAQGLVVRVNVIDGLLSDALLLVGLILVLIIR